MKPIPTLVLSILLGFILGSIPFGYLAGRLRGIDIRKQGSGNIGATNVFRQVGTVFGLLVFLCDALKGFLPVFFGLQLGLVPVVIGAGAVLGHIFTPFLRFRGGKGVSTASGVLLALAPLSFLSGMVVWLIAVLISSYASVASLAFALLLPAFVAGARFLRLSEGRIENLLFTVFIATVIIVTHRSNIRRLVKGEESKFRWGKR